MAERLEELKTTRPTYNGVEVSYGLAPILNTFSKLSTQPRKPYWNLYLINLETIVRDCKNDKGSDEDIARKTITDCTVMAQYIGQYCRLTQPPRLDIKPAICFYLAHYEELPKQYLREKFPKGTEDRWKIRDEIEDILKKDGFTTTFDEAEVFFFKCGLKGNWPHKDLLKDLNQPIKGLAFRKTLMISHVPLDFHLYRTFKDFSILESYTGEIKVPKQLGKKVFNNEDVPFNKYTHLLYGDKYYLKSQLDIKRKRMLNEVAKKEHWNLVPEKNVLASLIALNPVDMTIYVKPDL